jgi:fermentation-respiration switch protein FrsA (DUF1100 family)
MRNHSLVHTLVAGTMLAIASLTPAAASSVPVAPSEATVMKSVQFDNGSIQMAGHLYLPEGFDENREYPVVISVHPGGGVKEQTAGLYARRLADEGFVTLAFDASHQGASGGEPRFLDDPMQRVADISSAVDYVTTLPFVDDDRIGVLGICAGSGAAIKAATTERRIKAVSTVSAVDVGAASRKGWDGKGSESDPIAILEAVAKQRTAEAAGAAPLYVPYVPEVGDTSAHADLQEAADYYRTPRGQHPNSSNKMLFTSIPHQIAFSGFDHVETLLTQPLLVVAGSDAGSLWHSKELYAKAPGPKELVLIKGATHMDLYDGERVDEVMKRLAPFYQKNL